ncbi:AGE family epimerase/isomerase [Paremcibacter congregatus]|uniref:AGE family epimerase/isomerase n=1 Tax=Paremcibacter congregatus TaxID=2043170 RepID=UPI0030EEE1B6|tara:strand:+ start:17710 stop:18888 length:1179 start_codon:yes stop_codon:yes gene_type:complete
MNFSSPEFLLQHCRDILDFYEPRVVDQSGGYYQNFLDDGTVFDPGFRQLVSSSRIIVNFALAGKTFDNPNYLAIARHGLDYLETTHWQPESGSYAWTLQDHKPQDMTQQSYGYAFVLLAYATAYGAGLLQDTRPLHHIYNILEEKFWLEEYGLYADEISPEGILQDYRGQNSNMHLCEALIAAYEATGEVSFLQRAKTIADNIVGRQASLTGGLIWEHYTPQFDIDWDYNKSDPKNLYRPWGFQPGHQTEWAKLLMMLYRHMPNPWFLERAAFLFNTAYEKAWDQKYGGLIYGFTPEGEWCDEDKYFWVQSESITSAAMLYKATGTERYHDQYTELWQYCWEHMVDHVNGAWFRILARDNSKYSTKKSLAGAKCDYHNLCTCLEVLRTLHME